jgi:hypothetical protein
LVLLVVTITPVDARGSLNAVAFGHVKHKISGPRYQGGQVEEAQASVECMSLSPKLTLFCTAKLSPDLARHGPRPSKTRVCN